MLNDYRVDTCRKNGIVVPVSKWNIKVSNSRHSFYYYVEDNDKKILYLEFLKVRVRRFNELDSDTFYIEVL